MYLILIVFLFQLTHIDGGFILQEKVDTEQETRNNLFQREDYLY